MGCELNPQITDFRSVEAAEFRNAMRSLASGVAIVATGKGTGRRGLTVSSVTSLCMDPPCLLVGINTSSETHRAILDSGCFGVNLLGIAQQDLALLFAGQGGVKGVDRFETEAWDQGVLDVPVLRTSICALECVFTSIRWSAHTASSSGGSLQRGTATARPSSIFTVRCARYQPADRTDCNAGLGKGIER